MNELNELRDRNYLLIESPSFTLSGDPTAAHAVAYVDFGRAVIEIHGIKFNLYAFLSTALAIGSDMRRYQRARDKAELTAQDSKIRFTTGGAEEKWETFAMKREDLNGTQDE